MSRYLLTSFLGLVIVVAAVLHVQHGLAEREALRDASESASVVAGRIIGPALTPAALTGGTPGAARLDAIVRRRVIDGNLVRVKVWTPAGRVAYSDTPGVTGEVFPLSGGAREALATGRTASEVSDLSERENSTEHGFGSLLEFYVPERIGRGREVLVELYERVDAATGSTEERLFAFTPAILLALVLLWATQVPLAARMTRRLQGDGAAREGLLRRAAAASREERRLVAETLAGEVTDPLSRIAGDLERAAAGGCPASMREAAGQAVAALHAAVGRLRTLVREIHRPPGAELDLGRELAGLAASLQARRLRATAVIDVVERPPSDVQDLVVAVAREAVANVARHSGARSATIRLSREGDRAVLVVEDDGRGMSQEDLEGAVGAGRLGLSLLVDLARDAGGSLYAGARPGGGTRLRLEAPWT